MVLDHEFGHALGFDHEYRQLNCGSTATRLLSSGP
jgi:hypothetical protein